MSMHRIRLTQAEREGLKKHGLPVGTSSQLSEAFRQGMAYAQTAIDDLHKTLDKLLEHCPDAECEECSKIVCPHHHPYHFHHDGCPACAEDSPPKGD